MAIEEEFSIEIPDKDADTIHSGELLSLVLFRSLPAGLLCSASFSTAERSR